MIIFSGSGRLGNQVLQLFYIESIRKKNEKVFSTGMGKVLSSFQGFEPIKNTDSKRFGRFFNHFIRRLLLFFSFIRIIGIRYEDDKTLKYYEKKGLLPIYFSYGYYQNTCYYNKDKIKKIKIKEEYINQAKKILTENSKNKQTLFVHIRHGDYGEEFSLPIKYYKEALIQKKYEKYFIIFIGDDPLWCEKEFSYINDKYISKNSMEIDLALMSLCDTGIISNSTFALIGTLYSKQTEPIIAPKYWMGYNKKTWLSEGLKTFNFLNFVSYK